MSMIIGGDRGLNKCWQLSWILTTFKYHTFVITKKNTFVLRFINRDKFINRDNVQSSRIKVLMYLGYNIMICLEYLFVF